MSVAWKSVFSIPRRVRKTVVWSCEVPVKPEPRDWAISITIRTAETTIWTTFREVCIVASIVDSRANTSPNGVNTVAHTIDLSAEPRSVTGKKVKHLRAEGKIPANLYGHGVESTPIQVDAKELVEALRHATATTLV